jgi:superfamily II DNA or RNA helicase
MENTMTQYKPSRPHQVAALTKIANSVKLIINFPTGTGKSLIQARAIAQAIQSEKNPGVYVVLTPRILLSNQIYQDISYDLANSSIDAQYLIVNSGSKTDKSNRKWFDALCSVQREQNLPYRELPSTTSSQVVKDTYEKAQREGVPLVIIGNYHSAAKIVNADLPINDLYCDEAHNLVPGAEEEKDFSKITTDWFKADRKFYFTATMKYTNGIFGMKNEDRFGEAFSLLPAELIQAGELLRPRIHLVEMPSYNLDTVDGDVTSILSAFEEHRAMLAFNSAEAISPKLLIIAKGSKHLDEIVSHPKMKQLLDERRKLTIFDISSAHQPRINGEVVTREVFLIKLQGLTDYDEAIIVHVRILSEGIDVPGITGIMPLNNLKKSTFLQTLGRAARLHLEDRRRLYANVMNSSELKKFVKPYAWVILPTYGELGSEIKADLVEIIKELRTFGFNPSEDIFIKTEKGEPIPKSLDTIKKSKDPKMVANLSALVFEIEHVIEAEDIANRISDDKNKIKTLTDEELALNF